MVGTQFFKMEGRELMTPIFTTSGLARILKATLLYMCLCVMCPVLATDQLNLSDAELHWLKQHPNPSIAFDSDFPPYSFVNEQGQLEGLAVDITKRLQQKLGLTFDFVTEPSWQQLFHKAQQRQVDIVATMVATENRKQDFLFSQPYIFKSLAVLTAANNQNINHKRDLAGKRISLVKGYNASEQVLKQLPDVSPHYVDTLYDALLAVSLGEADATVLFFGASQYYRNKYLMTDVKFVSLLGDSTFNESYAVRKDWPIFQRILDKALAAISEQEMQSLRSNWLPKDYFHPNNEVLLTDAEKRWLQQHKEIRIGVDPEFAPFEFIEGDEYLGMAADYVDVLNQRLNINMQVVPNLTWKQVISEAKQQQIDVLPAVGKNQQRLEFLNFTQPYLNFHRVIIARDDLPFISSIDDIGDMKVAVQANSSHSGFIKEQTDIIPVTYPTLQGALMAVSGGEADVLVGNVASSTYWIRKLNLSNLKVSAPVSNEVQQLHFAVRKDWPELVSILQKGLDSISEHQRQDISNKWLKLNYQADLDYSLIWQLVIIFTLVLLFFVFWNLALNRKVKQRTEELNYSANYDRLTGLPNYLLVMDRLNQALNEASSYRHKLAVLSINLNDIKKINSVYGHVVGDKVLNEVATRLNNVCLDASTIGRLGGNHFALILSRYDIPDEIVNLAEKCCTGIKQPLTIGNSSLNLSANLGIALYPEDGSNAEELLKKADSAANHLKNSAQAGIAFYTEQFTTSVSRRLSIEQSMLVALNKQEFQVYYQPKVDTISREIVGFEALARWYSSDREEWIFPDEFIHIAEQNGMIEELGWFVLESALTNLKRWQQQYNSSLTMAINLSPKQLYVDNFLDELPQLLRRLALNPNTLELEITEGVFMESQIEVEHTFSQLKQLGVKVAMDDFGTGYSSLSYLRKYSFDTLKIDREFIMELEHNSSDQKLVSATIAMAHGLGLKVVAEGVETESHYQYLLEHQCDLLQGWLFSKALPASEVEDKLAGVIVRSGT